MGATIKTQKIPGPQANPQNSHAWFPSLITYNPEFEQEVDFFSSGVVWVVEYETEEREKKLISSRWLAKVVSGAVAYESGRK